MGFWQKKITNLSFDQEDVGFIIKKQTIILNNNVNQLDGKNK